MCVFLLFSEPLLVLITRVCLFKAETSTVGLFYKYVVFVALVARHPQPPLISFPASPTGEISDVCSVSKQPLTPSRSRFNQTDIFSVRFLRL